MKTNVEKGYGNVFRDFKKVFGMIRTQVLKVIVERKLSFKLKGMENVIDVVRETAGKIKFSL